MVRKQNSFVGYRTWEICNAFKRYLESMIFPIPNTNEALLGKSLGICEVLVGRVSKKENIISIEILMYGDWYPNKLEFKLLENYLDELLQGWNKITDFDHNGIEYIGNDKLMIDLGNFLRMSGCIKNKF